ncbi:hypothetical protein [Massilia sp. DD77]|uniref:hypothetical protein n=1 Tax=Massilia sp. DD77 TaxID=3109349 RepID=UPI002FFEAF42
MSGKLILSTICFVLLLLLLYVLSWQVGASRTDAAFNQLVLVFGLSLGWAAGILIAPYSRDEQRQFSTLAKSVTAFGSGYLLGKLDQIFKRLFDHEFELNSLYGFRLLAGGSAFVLAAIITYVHRRYHDG